MALFVAGMVNALSQIMKQVSFRPHCEIHSFEYAGGLFFKYVTYKGHVWDVLYQLQLSLFLQQSLLLLSSVCSDK